MTARTTPGAWATPRRTRPADRREIVLRAAVTAFGAHGYAATRLSDIADEVGISTPALYRHFDTKYQLFTACVNHLSQSYDEAMAAVPEARDPRSEITWLLAAFTAVTLDNRTAGNLYRWEHRVLRPADRAQVRHRRISLHRRMRGLIERARPALDRPSADLITVAALSVSASPATHRVAMHRRTAIETITRTATGLIDVDLPIRTAPAVRPDGLAPTSRREAILSAAVALFARNGFHEVTVGDIGTAAGLPASGVYRHFSSKNAILTAALWRTADRTTDAIATGLAQAHTPDEALVALSERYSALCVDDPEIMTVYLSGAGALDDGELRALRRQQRLTVDEWATWVVRARPELSTAAARYLVHASLNLAGDLVTAYPGIDVSAVAATCCAVLAAN
ncbi:TetR/AcrR family transcriptional regulator [Gordonia zhaorongruii]|uniref:TetR/AcrR family transcriptional regulator n=1 Tax=Gordonia zhaorongruii TaxID=2597659 RepID=UPI00117EE50C|nr:TetR/AcrR family transcriptional regulator [Gordonia zhaorongruii]